MGPIERAFVHGGWCGGRCEVTPEGRESVRALGPTERAIVHGALREPIERLCMVCWHGGHGLELRGGATPRVVNNDGVDCPYWWVTFHGAESLAVPQGHAPCDFRVILRVEGHTPHVRLTPIHISPLLSPFPQSTTRGATSQSTAQSACCRDCLCSGRSRSRCSRGRGCRGCSGESLPASVGGASAGYGRRRWRRCTRMEQLRLRCGAAAAQLSVECEVEECREGLN
eukprot:317010-Chlamydomonas_euryale.AAC.3